MRLLVLLEQELAVVHDAADRRIRCRRDLHEIQVRVLRHLQCFLTAQDANLAALSIDHAHTRRRDLFVAPNALTSRSSDALYLQTSPAAARDFLGKFLSKHLDGHRSEILATARAHGQRIRTYLAITSYQ